jgi:hypothetical protein
VRRSDEGFTLVGLVSSVGVGAVPVGWRGGAWQRRPRLALHWRVEARGGFGGGSVSFSRVGRSQKAAQTARGSTELGRLSRAAAMAWRQLGGSAPVHQARKREDDRGTTPIYASWACSIPQGTPGLSSTPRSSATAHGGCGVGTGGDAGEWRRVSTVSSGWIRAWAWQRGPTRDGVRRRGTNTEAGPVAHGQRACARVAPGAGSARGEDPRRQALFSICCTTVCPAQTQNFCTKLENLQIRKL